MMQGVGLVLAGSFGNGSYQIGVWKALREFGIDQNITALAGASVGAFNAVLFIQGDYSIAEKLWIDMDGDKTFTVGIRNLMGSMGARGLSFKKNYGMELFSRQGLESLIDENVDLDGLGNSAMDFFVTAYNPDQKRVEYFKTKGESPPRIKKILLAAAAQPFGFGAEEIEGEVYVDAGGAGNVPIKPLYDRGIRHFVVITGGDDYPVRAEEFLDANIIEIAAGSDGHSGSGKQDKRKGPGRNEIRVMPRRCKS